MKRIFITGGTGFLGKRLARVLKSEGCEVLLGGRNQKLASSAELFSGCASAPIDVANIDSVRDAFGAFQPDIVIHAAATKYVDKAELYPHEAIDINVTGSQNVARVALEQQIELVIGISTDKAAPPVRNTYGLTKALMERLFCSLDRQGRTKFLCVRYGNVAWSTGSVLGMWKQMLERSGVIETTGPQMTRFFFTIDDAVELVMTALRHADKLHGKVLAREMKSAKLEDILKLWTSTVGGKYKTIVGRPGERSLEYLFGDLELPYVTEAFYGDIAHFVIDFNTKSINPVKYPLSSESATRLTESELLELINNPPEEER